MPSRDVSPPRFKLRGRRGLSSTSSAIPGLANAPLILEHRNQIIPDPLEPLMVNRSPNKLKVKAKLLQRKKNHQVEEDLEHILIDHIVLATKSPDALPLPTSPSNSMPASIQNFRDRRYRETRKTPNSGRCSDLEKHGNQGKAQGNVNGESYYSHQYRPRRQIPGRISCQDCLNPQIPGANANSSPISPLNTVEASGAKSKVPNSPRGLEPTGPQTPTPFLLVPRTTAVSYQRRLNMTNTPGSDDTFSLGAETGNQYSRRHRMRSPIALEYDLKVAAWRKEAHRKAAASQQEGRQTEIQRKPMGPPIKFPNAASQSPYMRLPKRTTMAASAVSTATSTRRPCTP